MLQSESGRAGGIRRRLRSTVEKRSWIAAWSSLTEPLLDFVYPPWCVLCNNDLDAEVLVCRTCLETLPRLEEPVLAAEKLTHQLSGPAWFEASIAVFPFHESIQKLIHLMKYKGYESLAQPLGRELGLALRDAALPEAAILAPVPLHRWRLAERGYNQSERLAQYAATTAGLPMHATLLQRIRYTRPQAKLAKAERSRNLAGAFVVPRPEDAAGGVVVLVDDLFTTGHTLNECAKTLKAQGCRQVYCLTLVRV